MAEHSPEPWMLVKSYSGPEWADDGPTFGIAVPAGDGRQRIEELINSFVAALWGDACP